MASQAPNNKSSGIDGFGRKFNEINDKYLLPADNAEWKRLDKQHTALKIAMQGLYPCTEVDAILAPQEGVSKFVLDVGCGSGAWPKDMAEQFPHANILGIDVAKVPVDAENLPKNLRYEVRDVNNDLSDLHDHFDFIHWRCIGTGIVNARKTLTELQRCLKPGGLFLMIEGVNKPQDDADGKVKFAKVEGDEDVSGVSEDGWWFARIHYESLEACAILGSDVRAVLDVSDLGFWDFPLCDPSTAVTGSVNLPIGPWPSETDAHLNEQVKYLGMLMQENILKLHRAMHPMLRRHGIPQATLDDWSAHVDEDLQNGKMHNSVRFGFSYARRRAADGGPAPALPSAPPPLNLEASSASRSYRMVEKVYSAEDARLARQRRIDSLGPLPTPAVRRAYLAAQAQS